jgi:hemerythrin-like domain-containing protein
MPVQIGSKASDFSDPTGLMSDCHRRIEMFLNTLRAAGDFNGRQLAEDERRSLDAALRYFREAAPKHNADEEESLFPRLRSVPDPQVRSALADVVRLEQEHHWAAPLHAEVDRLGQQWLLEGRLAADQARAFQSAVGKLDSMYRTHIDFEDRVLFPLVARFLSPDQRAEVAQEMAKRRNLNSFALRKLQPPGAVTEAVHAAPSEIGRGGPHERHTRF